MTKLYLFLLDIANNKKEEIELKKPNNYNQLLNILRQKINYVSEQYDIFIIDSNNREMKITNEENYLLIKDILFIREIDKDRLEKSLFEINLEKLSISKQNILIEKYVCTICMGIIKNENPYFCYNCQKTFHAHCLIDWDNRRMMQNQMLNCPNCRKELSLEYWKKNNDFEENRKDHANLLNQINEYKLKLNMNNIINLIKDKKINELNNKYNKLKTEYDEIINKKKLYLKK